MIIGIQENALKKKIQIFDFYLLIIFEIVGNIFLAASFILYIFKNAFKA